VSVNRVICLAICLAPALLAGCRAAPHDTPAAPAPKSAAQPAAAGDGIVSGTAAESMNTGGYTYVRLQTDKGDVWIAASEFPVKAGERLTVRTDMPMRDYHSTALNRDFPLVYFVSEVAREGRALSPAAGQSGGAALPAGHPAAGAEAAAAPVEPIAPPSGGLSIADVWARRASLSGKTVVVSGTVVKVNNGIMDRNWLHLQDGSGSPKDKNHDLTVTTAAEVKVGDVVTASGVLGTAKDFGAGYAYDAILEKATVTVK
jgi:hypothetical protein